MKLKMVFNKNQIDYINKKIKKLFKIKLFRISILIFFISTPLILIKTKSISPSLEYFCDKLQKKEINSFSAKKTYKNCLKKIKGINEFYRITNIENINNECKKIKEFEELHIKLLTDDSLKYDRGERIFIKDYSNLDSRVIELVNQYKTYKYLRNLSYIPMLVESKSENPFDYLLTMEYFQKNRPYDSNSCNKELLGRYVDPFVIHFDTSPAPYNKDAVPWWEFL